MPTTLTRSLLVNLIPATVASSPWLLFLFLYFGDKQEAYNNYTIIINIICFCFVATLGTIFECISTRTEIKWDKEREGKYDVIDNWFYYLSVLLPKNEPVGFRYISGRVTVMYFELAMRWASIIFCVGLIVVIDFNNIVFEYKFILVNCDILSAALLLIAVGLCYVFHNSAKAMHEVLCEARKKINEQIKAQIKELQPTAT